MVRSANDRKTWIHRELNWEALHGLVAEDRLRAAVLELNVDSLPSEDARELLRLARQYPRGYRPDGDG